MGKVVDLSEYRLTRSVVYSDVGSGTNEVNDRVTGMGAGSGADIGVENLLEFDDSGLEREFLKRKLIRFVCFADIPSEQLEFIGSGKSARVYRLVGTKYVVKVYRDIEISKYREEYYNEVNSYLEDAIRESDHFIEMLHFGSDYIVLEYVEGRTLYEMYLAGEFINPGIMRLVTNELERLERRAGIYGNDVHGKNVMVTDSGKVYIIDLGRFCKRKLDRRWEYVHRVYNRFYGVWFLPNSVGDRLLKRGVSIYKWIERWRHHE